METYKIIKSLTYTLATSLLFSCGGTPDQDSVSKEKYDKMVTEYKDINSRQEGILKEHQEQSKVINDAVTELASISGNTITLRKNVETGTASMTQAEELMSRISNVKKALANSAKISKANKELKKMIESLENMVAEKEKEISALTKEIEAQRKTIKEQQGVIKSQGDDIEAKKQVISNQQRTILNEQANTWYVTARSLEDALAAMPEVKGSGDKKKMDLAKKMITERMTECYNTAAKLGSTEAKSRLLSITAK